MLEPVRMEPLQGGYMVLLGDSFVFMLQGGDVGPAGPGTTRAGADAIAERLHRTLEARALLLTPGRRWTALAWSIVATILLVLLPRLLSGAQRHAMSWFTSHTQGTRSTLKLGDVDIFSYFTWLVSWLARSLTQVAGVVFVVFWAVFVLNRFPETQELGAQARDALFGIIQRFQMGLLQAIPGIVAVALVYFLGRFVTRLVNDLFGGVERGTIR